MILIGLMNIIDQILKYLPTFQTTNVKFLQKVVILPTFAPSLKRNGNNNIIMRKKKKHCLQCEKYNVLHEYNLVVGQKKLIYKFLLFLFLGIDQKSPTKIGFR